mmetsp:Transcript_21646/g.22011  ORF Transcript_21646/g.22011 Transcript_21646/m.22011 type:complete len:81 (+) Transcript_21646:65-307(+)
MLCYRIEFLAKLNVPAGSRKMEWEHMFHGLGSSPQTLCISSLKCVFGGKQFHIPPRKYMCVPVSIDLLWCVSVQDREGTT